MLDAGGPALGLEMLDLSSEYVQTGADSSALLLSAEDAPADVNSPPANIQILPLSPIDEDGIASLELVFDDVDPLLTHTVEVDWGDGEVEVFNVPSGSQFFGTTHQYFDDDPSVTSSDIYTVNVTVRDSAGGMAEETAPITVNNVAPSNLQIAPMAPIDENGVGTLELTFEDPGTLDSHTVEVDWGDGSVEVFNVPQGSRFFGTTHQYLDDDPSGTSADAYTVNVRVLDDDSGEATGSSSITVSNIASSNLQIDSLGVIDENGVAQLNLSFDDPGTLDTHTVEVDWGDGSPLEVLAVTPGARTFSTTHQYLDDNPTGTSSDIYTVNIRLLDDDLGEVMDAKSVTVNNVAPFNVQIDPLAPVDENGFAVLNLAFDDPGTLDSHMVDVDWGDGSAVETLSVSAGARSFAATHQYLDDNPTATLSDSYTVTVKVRDDDGGEAMASAPITVNNVAPLNVVVVPVASAIVEGGQVSLSFSFDDPGSQDTHTYQIDWGDGLVTAGAAVGHAFNASHIYADNGNYTVSVTVMDDDGGVGLGSGSVTVSNAAPSLTAAADQTVSEGSLLTLVNIGSFTDPGFDNPLNAPNVLNGGETAESFTFTINWGDATATDAGAATIDVMGGPGAPTSGSFDGQHTYADNGVYTVTVTVFDDDGGQDQGSFQVTVLNVSPTLVVSASQTVNEGSLLALVNIGSFTDPGFNNPLNAANFLNGGETVETFTFTINWGDGAAIDAGAATVDMLGSPGTLTSGSFDGQHTYADNGVYTVSVTVFDDDLGQHQQAFQVTVLNVDPALSVAANQTVNEGSLLLLVDVGLFTDPGFDNPLNAGNALNGGETVETFTFTINWGDGTAVDAGGATVDMIGSPGTPTSGSFDGQHTYADNGAYTVTVTVHDDDMGSHQQTFQVTVLNIDPTLRGISPSPTVNEGQAFTLVGLGVGIEDPGFDNPLNAGNVLNGGETEETFTGVTVDWGDGAPVDALTMTNRVSGGPGVLTTADFVHAPHTYADNGVYTVTVSLSDDDGPIVARTLTIIVNNVAPTVAIVPDQEIHEGSQLVLVNIAQFTDPGFNNPLNAGNVANGGEFEETFTYTIDWGDGSNFQPGDDAPAESGATSIDVLGSPGVLTAGSFDAAHTYVDNGVYTVTVTVRDDDNGVTVKTFSVAVKNVSPTLDDLTFTATDVNTAGQTVITGMFTDPGRDTYVLFVDWGDNQGPHAETFAVTPSAASSGLHTFTAAHTYTEPPDPLHPAADIHIIVRVHDDDFPFPQTAGSPVDETGESNPVERDLTNPGLGNQTFRIDTTPQVELLTFPDRPSAPTVFVAQETRTTTATNADEGGSGGDSRAASERFLELRVIYPDGTMSEGYRLRSQVLNNLPGLFRNLPDNHYAIYLVQSETNVRRLVIEVFVRNGKLIDPGDDSEGARDRPPTDQTNAAPREKIELPSDAVPEEGEAAAPAEAKVQLPNRTASSTAMYHRSALAGVALALSGAGRNWHRELEAALVRAKPNQWKRLKTAGHRRRRKPR